MNLIAWYSMLARTALKIKVKFLKYNMRTNSFSLIYYHVIIVKNR